MKSDCVRIALEALLGDRDGLDARATAGDERVADRREIRRPVALAHGLDHLDRRDGVEASAHVAVVLQRSSTRSASPASRTRSRAHSVWRADSEMPGHAMSRPRGRLREPAPAGADLEHVRVGTERERPEQPVVLRLLRRLERARGIAVEERRRVRHRAVEPQRVEVVAEVVVRGDVAPRLAARVRAEPVAHPQQRARPTGGRRSRPRSPAGWRRAR
jgi:hypothetical protein